MSSNNPLPPGPDTNNPPSGIPHSALRIPHSKEPRNPFYLLLLLTSLLFVVTALAYAVVPVLEEKAALAGSPAPPSPFRDSLRTDGWRWLLYEVAAMIVFGLLSMGLDRLRRLQSERAAGKMPPANDPTSPPAETKGG